MDDRRLKLLHPMILEPANVSEYCCTLRGSVIHVACIIVEKSKPFSHKTAAARRQLPSSQ